MERILVALDESSLAAAVLAESIELAWAMGARVRLFRAIPPQPEVAETPWELMRDFSSEEVERKLVAEARGALERQAHHVSPSHLDSVEVVVGKPWSAICAAADRWGADLIVMGAHGYGLVDRVMGTTAAKVVNHSSCSIMVVRGREVHAVETKGGASASEARG